MLKGIPDLLSPDLLKVLAEMGHGDEIVLADGNFPSASMATRLLRSDGHGVPEILDAIMKLFPLDTFVAKPAVLMGVVPGDHYQPVIWQRFQEVITAQEPGFTGFETVDRFSFYERARRAYAIVATGEKARYANIILKKGIL